MSWLKKIFSKSVSKHHLTNSNSEKSFDEIYKDPGAFQYDREGFTITYEDFRKRVKWSEITQLNVYKIDQMTIDRIDMEIVLGDTSFTISEELPGWYQFVLKTKEIYPNIPKDWDIKIIQPAFATNYRTIYQRESPSPES